MNIIFFNMYLPLVDFVQVIPLEQRGNVWIQQKKGHSFCPAMASTYR